MNSHAGQAKASGSPRTRPGNKKATKKLLVMYLGRVAFQINVLFCTRSMTNTQNFNCT